MKVNALLALIDRLAPFQLAEPWDKVGLQVGASEADVGSLLVALDADETALAEAERRGCDAVLAHHPLLFRPLEAVTDESHAGAVAMQAIAAGRAILVAHTNLDKARGGLADIAAAILGLEGVRPLEPAAAPWLKLVGFVPSDEVGSVSAAVFAAGAGVIGNYEHCSFAIPGTGTFRPRLGASPAIGTPGMDNATDEVRLEVVFPRDARRAVLDAYVAAHSYEEPAYDVYPVEDEIAGAGLGRVGYLPEPETLAELVERVGTIFRLPAVRYVGDARRRLRRVAVLPGSGASIIPAAVSAADALITGDVKYHDADAARRSGLALIEISHEAAESLLLERWADVLGDELGPAGVRVEWYGRDHLWCYATPAPPQPGHLGLDDVEAAEPDGPFELYVDGGARGNPGPAGIGARLVTADGEVAEELADFIGVATNNVAEYQALIAGLEMALDHGARRLIVYADSELVVRQLNGQYRVRNEDLAALHEQALRLLRELPDAQVKHIPREQNAEADRLVNQAIDAASS